ncbi:MAG TPA: DMSO reductase [Flexistipes sinusarabici]|uniref:DMSO reductase n=1 Tax=Flexistipes sinusarabici TaxID=2352 RepID=A0A3D5QBU7_FLESI|nr:DMSO reductase [Flexistipes sinusarabici]
MSKQLAFLVDSKKCIGCYSCAMACKNQYHQEPGVKWRDLNPLPEKIYPHRDRAFYSLSCNHCASPVCVSVCPVNAHTKRETDGIVVHDAEKCIYCKACINSCSYGASKDNKVQERAEKCSFCVERIDKGLLPACVLGCPTKALSMIDLDKADSGNIEQYPKGFEKHTKLNPSTRFVFAKTPKLVTSDTDA